MTEKELETIKDNLNAYRASFDYISIEKENFGKGMAIRMCTGYTWNV